MRDHAVETSADAAGRPGFGFMRIVRDARALFMRAPGLWVLIAVPPAVLAGARAALQANGQPVAALVCLLLGLAATAFALAMMYQLAWSAWSGDPAPISHAVRVARQRALPFLGCVVLAILPTLIGLALLVLPGLYLWAVFAMLGPVIVIEGKGLKAFEHSFELTKGYRWPTLGLLVCAAVAVVAVSFVLGFVLGAVHAISTGGAAPGSSTVLQAAATAVGQLVAIPIWGVVTAACYRRLKAIKTGRTDDAAQDADWPFTATAEADPGQRPEATR